ncbi:MAG: flagellar hook-associated protein FlgK [Acidobacteriota bacterium]
MSTNLFSSLHVGASSVRAHSQGIDVVGQNLANVGTPGHAKRRTDFDTVSLSAGGGVRAGELRAIRNEALETGLRRETSEHASADARASSLSQVDRYFGDGAFEPLSGLLQGFYDSLSAASVDGNLGSRRHDVVAHLDELAAGVRTTASFLRDERRRIDQSLEGGVEDLNSLLQEIAQLNEAIDGEKDGADQQPMLDQLTGRLVELSELVDVHVRVNEAGGRDVSLRSGEPLVLGRSAVSFRSSGNASNAGLSDVLLGGFDLQETDVTASLQGGRLGGLLEARDGSLQGMEQRLDEIVVALADELDTLHAAGLESDGVTPGGPLFEARSTTDPAMDFAVSATLLSDPSRLALGDASDELGNVATLLATRDAGLLDGGTLSARHAFDELSQQVGFDVRQAERERDLRGALLDDALASRELHSGVSIEESSIDLIRYQRGLEAATNLIRQVDEMLDQLMSIGL